MDNVFIVQQFWNVSLAIMPKNTSTNFINTFTKGLFLIHCFIIQCVLSHPISKIYLKMLSKLFLTGWFSSLKSHFLRKISALVLTLSSSTIVNGKMCGDRRTSKGIFYLCNRVKKIKNSLYYCLKYSIWIINCLISALEINICL